MIALIESATIINRGDAAALRIQLRLRSRAHIPVRPLGGTNVHWTFVCFRLSPCSNQLSYRPNG